MKAQTNKKCGVCNFSERRLAIQINMVDVCYGCIDFFNGIAKYNKIDPLYLIAQQTKYISSLQTKS